jgi:hypothetical protein
MRLTSSAHFKPSIHGPGQNPRRSPHRIQLAMNPFVPEGAYHNNGRITFPQKLELDFFKD